MQPLLVDTGPLMALFAYGEPGHAWARDQFSQHERILTCEAVLTETCFLLARDGVDPAQALQLVERGAIHIGMSLAEEMSVVRALMERYSNVPASLADACLIRLSELYQPCRVMTFDRDFQVYRRNGRQVIPLLMP